MAEKKFRVIPLSIMQDQKLEFGARLLYGEIGFLAGKEGYCWASNEYFAKTLGTSQRTIRRWLDQLETGFKIRREMDQEGLVSERRIIPLIDLQYKVKIKTISIVPNEIKKVYK
jgi:CTP-dependent riboflavin kinase